MSALVNNLLDMARDPKRRGQAEHAVAAVRRSRRQRSEVDADRSCAAIASRSISNSDLPLVEFDAVLIERVLCNLLENAAKYTPAGSTIRLAAAASGKDLLVSVTDNGPGLPKGQEEAIFEKFTRGERESATIRRRPGPGHLPRHRRSAQGQDLGREQPGRRSAVRRSRCRSARRRRCRGHRGAAADRLRPSHERADAASRYWSRTNGRSAASCATRSRRRAGRCSRPRQ